MLLLLTTTHCPNCPAMKRALAESSATFDALDETKPDFLETARRYGVRSVPTLLALDDEGNELARTQDSSSLPTWLAEHTPSA